MPESLIPIVLLPGTGCNESLWHGILPFLPQDKILPIMPNILQYSDQESMLNHIYRLPYEKFILLGFSMGGYLAQHFYVKHPHRVENLILLCTSGDERRMNEATIENNMQKLMHENYLMQMIKSDTPKPQRDQLIEQLRTMLNEVGLDTVRHQMLATKQRQSVLQLFPAQPVPTLVVGARYDTIVPKSAILRLATALQATANVEWVDCGHMLPLEQPETLGLILQHWLFCSTKAKGLINRLDPLSSIVFCQ